MISQKEAGFEIYFREINFNVDLFSWLSKSAFLWIDLFFFVHGKTTIDLRELIFEVEKFFP